MLVKEARTWFRVSIGACTIATAAKGMVGGGGGREGGSRSERGGRWWAPKAVRAEGDPERLTVIEEDMLTRV